MQGGQTKVWHMILPGQWRHLGADKTQPPACAELPARYLSDTKRCMTAQQDVQGFGASAKASAKVGMAA